MKATYYSAYPYAHKDWKKSRVNAKDYHCSWGGDALLLEFRLYKAARCVTLDNNISVNEFVCAMYEAMDCPQYKGVEDYLKPYTLEGVKVFPTSNLYGATNSNDGVYVVDGEYYTIDNEGVKKHASWEDAFNCVRNERRFCCGRYMLRGVNYERI